MKLALGIETSCDETSVALVRSDKKILAHIISSQIKEHQIYGGVVPEVAARSHLKILPMMLSEIFKQANVPPSNIDVVAATTGPGLIGGVVIGAMAAKALSAALNKPFVAVNHLEGHALTARLTDDVTFPFLLLLVSGGHCQIMWVRNIGNYQLLGSTLDDAVGECFDKVAKMLDLPYPGGPEIEKCATNGNPKAYPLPRPMIGQKNLNFSFSGLKTAVRRLIEQLKAQHADKLPSNITSDICASFQSVISAVLFDRVNRALIQLPECKSFVVSGGVAANQSIRKKLQEACDTVNVKFYAPPLKLCTDNGAMIAWAGLERFQVGLIDSLRIRPRPRWPMDEIREASI